MAGLEVAHDDVRPDRQPHVVARVDAEELVQDGLDLQRLADLDEHRRRELTRPGQERVVDPDLLRDLRLVHDALGADHLLDLEPDGLPVLEDEGEVAAHGDAAGLLQLDDLASPRFSHPLVLDEVQDL